MKIVVDKSSAGERLDRVVMTGIGVSRKEAERLIDEGEVRLDGKRANKGARVRAGQTVTATVSGPADKKPVPEKRELEILYQDDALVAVNKPPGWATHPLLPGETGTLANVLVAHFPECAEVADDPREGGVAHRLDRETSGLVLAARSRAVWQALRAAFHAGQIEKRYLALVVGEPPARGEVIAPLVQRGKRVRVDVAEGLDAETEYECIAQGHNAALVRCLARTGRMHQIRAHMAHTGHPLVGDTLYGAPEKYDDAQHAHILHAHELKLVHPTTMKPLALSAPLPKEIRTQLVAVLGTLPEGI